jgi:hypothetical protein
MCRAREREHPEYHDVTRLAAFRRSQREPGVCRRFVVAHDWIPAFAGMTDAVAAGLSRPMGGVMHDNPCKLFPLYAMR